MFTGIIEAIGRIQTAEALKGGRRFRIQAPFASELRVDESVAVNGVCLTVTAQNSESFSAVAIEETLAKTALGGLGEGSEVNLERALRVGARLDGHLVQGHVDAVGHIDEVETLADSHLVRIRYPEEFAAYLIPTGSITVDGISLTIARLDEPAGTFAVAIIPHTWTHTNADQWSAGRAVQLEFDVLGKYAVRRLSLGAARQS
ncbi:riboflavin synthase [soil metagenome]